MSIALLRLLQKRAIAMMQNKRYMICPEYNCKLYPDCYSYNSIINIVIDKHFLRSVEKKDDVKILVRILSFNISFALYYLQNKICINLISSMTYVYNNLFICKFSITLHVLNINFIGFQLWTISRSPNFNSHVEF